MNRHRSGASMHVFPETHRDRSDRNAQSGYRILPEPQARSRQLPSSSSHRVAASLASIHAPVFGTTTATWILSAAAVCFGLVPLFARSLQEGGTGSAMIALYRFGLGALLLLPCLPLARDKRREAALLGGAGLAMGLSWIGYLECIKVSTVAAAGILYMSYPVFTTLFAWIVVGQSPTLRAWMSVLLVLAAAGLVFSPESIPPAAPIALLWALPAPMAFGFVIVVVSGCMKRLGALERMACLCLGATLGLAPPALGSGGGEPFLLLREHWALIGGIALFTALVPQLLYVHAAPCVGPARSAATGSFELPTMILVGWLGFGETVGWREILAAMLSLGAVLAAPAVGVPRVEPPGSPSASLP